MSKHKHRDVNVRFIQAISTKDNVNVYLDDTLIAGNLSSGELTAYHSVKSGTHYLIVKGSGDDSTSVIWEEKIKLRHANNTIALSGSIETPLTFKYRDSSRTPDFGYGKIRFINLTPGSTPINVSLNGKQIFSDVKFSESTEYYNYKLTGEPVAALVVTGQAPSILYVESKAIITLFNFNGVIVASVDNGPYVYGLDALQKDFDVTAYMGEWIQIADIPQFYEQGCPRAVAYYTLLNSRVKVFNRCFNEQWKETRSITGRADVKNPLYPAALTVAFPNVGSFVSPNYLVHATDYDGYAIVGSPSRSSFYILSRSQKMSKKQYAKILKYAEFLGYPIDKIVLNYDTLE